MGASPEPGCAMAVVWRGPNAGTAYGRLRSATSSGAAVDMNGEITWTPGDPVLLVASEGSSRLLARASYVTSRGNAAVFTLDQPFRRFDLRSQTRYPVVARAEVRSVHGMARHPGVVFDMSLGGMAVEVPAKPGGKSVEVSVQIGGYAATLPCEMVGVTTDEQRVILHLKFTALTPAQQAFVRNVVAELQSEFEQVRLAS